MRRLAVAALIAAVTSLALAGPSQAQEMASRQGGQHHGDNGGHQGNHQQHHRHIHGPLIYANPAPYPLYVYAVPVGGYWYYCPSAQMYYPSVTNCLDAWIPVPAQ